MHLSATHLVGAFVLVAGLTSTSAHSIHRRGSQQQHKDLAERMAQPAADAAQGDAANIYARALNDAQAGKYRITRRAANPVGRAGQKKVIRKRADGATCKIRPSVRNETESASVSAASSTASATYAASTASEWWATSTAAASAESSASAWSSSSSAWVEPSASASATWAADAASWSEPASSSAKKHSSSSSAAPAATSASTTSASTSTGQGTAINQVTNNVLLAMTDDTCGPCDATHEFPNGSEDWINCGMKAGGWTPPHVSVSDLRVGDATALKSQYPQCSDEILAVMTQVSAETGVSSQLLLSIAIRESACDVNARGGGGEVGLMQVANNRCPNQHIPKGQWDSCMDPYNNIKLGADIFNEKLSSAGGNVLEALGAYNGWTLGMTYDGAHNGAVCAYNRNRDYVHSIVNGFMQGVDASGWSNWGQNGC